MVIFLENFFVSVWLSTYVDRISNGSVSSELTEPVNKHLQIRPAEKKPQAWYKVVFGYRLIWSYYLFT